MSGKLVFQNYLVAFLDLVGQRETLRKMLSIPTTPEEEKEFIEIARRSLGKVLQMRKEYRGFFEGAKRDALDLSQFSAQECATIEAAMQSENGARIQAAMQLECSVYGLSDAIVIAVPLNAQNEDGEFKAVRGVEIALLAMCGLTIRAFATRVAYRGGVDIGIATMLDGGEVYGPALARAYCLESEVAEYPRVVVGNDLFRFLDDVAGQEPRSVFGTVATQYAIQCKRMIVPDTDGHQMLDFLGSEINERMRALLPPELVSRGHEFVHSEYRKFQQSGNDKLALRYFRLLQYFLARKDVWGL